MFQHMFAALNEKLSCIMEEYARADEEKRKQLDQQVGQLKHLSDSFIEQWLDFEDRFAHFQEHIGNGAESLSSAGKQAGAGSEAGGLASAAVSTAVPCNEADLIIPEEAASMIIKGQGYYKLFMFPQASEQFNEAVMHSPECNIARLYLAMTHMHLQNWNEAERHFQLLISLSDFPKWLAMGYNALGCIQAIHMNLAGAKQLFKKAHLVYPGFTDSLSNLKCCQETPKQLSLYFGSTELCCL